jgi:hypothetical protein
MAHMALRRTRGSTRGPDAQARGQGMNDELNDAARAECAGVELLTVGIAVNVTIVARDRRRSCARCHRRDLRE